MKMILEPNMSMVVFDEYEDIYRQAADKLYKDIFMTSQRYIYLPHEVIGNEAIPYFYEHEFGNLVLSGQLEVERIKTGDGVNTPIEIITKIRFLIDAYQFIDGDNEPVNSDFDPSILKEWFEL